MEFVAGVIVGTLSSIIGASIGIKHSIRKAFK